MFSVFESFKSFTRCREISIDNLVFQLHYRVTHLFLVIGSVLITGYQYWGNPISCRTSEGEASKSILDFCWIASTFTLPAYTEGQNGKDFVAPGVAGHDDEEEKKFHAYYQWVCIVLFGQAIFFYLPHFIWKRWEGSKLKFLVQDLASPVLSKSDKEKQVEIAVTLLDFNRSHQNVYAYKFVVCEVLNLVNVLLQMRFINKFLDYEFTTFGLEVLRFMSMEQPTRTDPMVKIFPKLTKCTFYEYGASGGIAKLDALCNLPLNNLNEKIFAVLWFWLVLLFLVTILQLIYRILTFTSAGLREGRLLSHRSGSSYDLNINYLMVYSNYGDWFVLTMLKKNINGYFFEEIVSGLVDALDERKKKMNFDSIKRLVKQMKADDANMSLDGVTIDNNTGLVEENSEKKSTAEEEGYFGEVLFTKKTEEVEIKTPERAPSYEEFDTLQMKKAVVSTARIVNH